LGGANCEAPMGPELVRHIEPIDYVFSGPALISFPQFVRSCIEGDGGRESIQGVYSKRNAAFPVLGQEAMGQELDINHYLRLDYEPFLDTLASNFSSNDISPVLLFETSRGCWWGEKAHCTFCGLNGGTMAYRAMRPEIAIQQFRDLFRYAPRCSTFNCVDNILPKNYVSEVLPFIDVPSNIEIFYEVKADLSRDDVQALSRARVKRVQPGIEALNTSTLKLMRKGTTVFQNLTLLKNCVGYGVHPEWNLLIGFPGEQEKVFEKYVRDLPLLAHLPPPTGVFHVRFDRYSPYFVKADEYGLKLLPSDFYSFIYPFSEATIEKIAYYFSNHDYGAPYIDAVANWSTRVQAQGRRWRARWQGSEGGAFPRLFWKSIGDRTVIYDSRFGAKIEHSLESDAIAILKLLEKPKRKADLLAQFPAGEGERHVAELERLGLVFEEEQRYMSLVTDAPDIEEEPIAIYQLASESPGQGVLA
jgi:ribosomal peptide maturation radical SAM protein 1